MWALLLALIPLWQASPVCTRPAAVSPPADWRVCSRHDPRLDKCLVESLNIATKSLVSGSKALRMPPINPLKIPAMKIRQKSQGMDFNIDMLDVTLLGLPGVTHFVKADLGDELDTVRLEWGQVIRTMVQTSRYSMKGNILQLPMNGRGKLRVVLGGLHVNQTLTGKGIQRDGHIFLEITNFTFNIEPEDVYIHFDNLFGGNKELGDAINLALNENWRVAYREIKPTLEATFGEVELGLARQLFSRLPLDLLFPDVDAKAETKAEAETRAEAKMKAETKAEAETRAEAKMKPEAKEELEAQT